MKKIINNKLFVVIGLLLVLFGSCQEDPEPGGTAVEKMAGQWFVRVNDAGLWFSITTYNTAENDPNSMWIQVSSLPDVIPPVKGKINVDLTAQTFSGEAIPNTLAAASGVPTFSVANGQIVTNGTAGPVSNSPADAIAFDVIVNGVTYHITGFHRTGFKEEEPAALNPQEEE